jgi:hypothetical protein
MCARDSEAIVPGKAYEMGVPFGRAPVGAWLRTLSEVLPLGCSVELVTPIGSEVKGFLAKHGETRPGSFLQADTWVVSHVERDGALATFAQLADTHSLTRLAVYLYVRSNEGSVLLEAEDGIETLFIADALSVEASLAIGRVADVHGPGVPSVAT